ncbi:homocysteine S-methyltransferase family protein [bacterium]|nr:homocysteine S-methyltransferase family protein [bacterium]
MISFSDFADTKKTILFDGATGSALLSEDNSVILPDILSLKRPGIVLALHEEYLEAGCDVVETNSFNSNPLVFESFGSKKSASECAKISAILAKKAAKNFSTPEKPRFVAGSVGPVFNQNGSLPQDETLLFEAYSIQISALLEGGVDLLIFETMQDIVQLNSALAAAKKINKDIPLIVSLSGKNGKTHTGKSFEEIVSEISKYDLFALGLNCEDFAETEKDAEIIKKISPIPLSIMPNLGFPEKINGKFLYKTTPAKFAGKMSELIQKFEPKIIGGCCGTTPEHIKAAAGKIFCIQE